MNSCAIIPQVRDNNGNIRDSKLFKDLLSLTKNNRSIAKKLYGISKNPKFLNDYKAELSFDDANEVTIESFIKLNLEGMIPPENIYDEITKGYKHINKESIEDNTENFFKLVNESIDFNNKSRFKNDYVAIVRRDDNRKLYISLEKKGTNNSIEAEKMEASYKLNRKLRDFLTSKGISISALDTLDLELGRTGVLDYSKAEEETLGLISLIRLAKGSLGERALPHVFSHFILDSLKDNTLVQRLLKLCSNKDIAESILGDSVGNTNYINTDILAREAVSKLIMDSLYNESSKSGIWDNLTERVMNVVRSTYSSMNESEVTSLLNGFRQEITDIISAHPEKISVEKLNSNYAYVEKNLAKLSTLLSSIIRKEKKRFEIYSLRNQNSDNTAFKEKQHVFINTLEASLINGDFLVGVVNYLNNALNTAKNITSRLDKLNDSTLSFQDKAKTLRNINNYIQSYSTILKDIMATLTDLDFMDDYLLDSIKGLVATLDNSIELSKAEYQKQAIKHFTDFILKYMPDEGVDINYGDKKHLSKADIANLILHSDKDVSYLNMWLDSAASSNDYIIKLADLAIKEKLGEKRLEVTEYIKKITAAEKLLKNSGITNTEFMYERDIEGNLTNNYLRKEEDINKLTPEQRNYYDTFMSIKETVMKYLPPYISEKFPTRVIQVRKDLIEKLQDSEPSTWFDSINYAVKNSVIKRVDDTEFGVKSKATDLGGEILRTIPIYFTKELENKEDVSHNSTAALIMFAEMAVNYEKMGLIVDSLEVGRDVLSSEDRVQQTEGNKPVVSIFKDMKGKIQVDRIAKKNNNAIQMYENLLNMQVYGEMKKDQGNIGNTNLNKQKVVSTWNKITSLNQLALNLTASLAAIIQDMNNVNIEAIGGNNFNMKQLTKATSTFLTGLFDYIKDINQDIKTSKIALFQEKFDVLHNYESDVRSKDWGKSGFKKLMNSGSLYFLLRIGSIFGESRTAMAQAYAYKMIDTKNGNAETNLWDALEVKYIDENNHSLGAHLVVREGVVKEDGTEFTDKDILAFSNKALKLNQDLFGIYNDNDKNALSTTCIGALTLLYRQWIVPAIRRRYSKAEYNFMAQQGTEGYYRTFGRFMKGLISDIKEQQFNIAIAWNGLTSEEKANIKKAGTELGILGALIFINTFLLSDWDDKDNPWLQRMVAYLARRNQTEIAAMTPSPDIVEEALRIFKSPFAGIKPVENMLSLIKSLLNPLDWGIEGLGDDRILQSGEYKGHSRLYKNFFESPVIPMRKTIKRAINPEKSITFFNI